jgi:hypothetical protein
LWCSQTGDHPPQDSAKFGDGTDLQVEFFKESFYILATSCNLLWKIWRTQQPPAHHEGIDGV